MVLWVLGPNTRRAYLRVARSLGLSLAHLHALRHAEMAQNDHSHAHTFFARRQLRVGREREPQRTVRCCHRRAGGPPEPREHSSRAAAPPEPPWAPPHSSKPRCLHKVWGSMRKLGGRGELCELLATCENGAPWGVGS